jgi:hypothetical protein
MAPWHLHLRFNKMSKVKKRKVSIEWSTREQPLTRSRKSDQSCRDIRPATRRASAEFGDAAMVPWCHTGWGTREQPLTRTRKSDLGCRDPRPIARVRSLGMPPWCHGAIRVGSLGKNHSREVRVWGCRHGAMVPYGLGHSGRTTHSFTQERPARVVESRPETRRARFEFGDAAMVPWCHAREARLIHPTGPPHPRR